ncbi:MAG TPA: hypothetical protein VL197_08195 [Nitrospirota bacterium]|nr:hypothetical protein [Nitrospirota bacterium]
MKNYLNTIVMYLVMFLLTATSVLAQPPQPFAAIHISELTQALETMPAVAPTPTGPGTTGHQWWVADWKYLVAPQSLEEAFRSDGTPYVEVCDADIAAGNLLNPDGTPRYPIVFSLGSEAINDNEIAPLRAYVNAGGFLFVGSSSFTRNPDGTTRGDFALATEMGVHMKNTNLQNWDWNSHITPVISHRLTAGFPTSAVSWRMPASAEEIPLGDDTDHTVHGNNDEFQVTSSGAAVIANCDTGPFLTTKQYGNGNFIYHGAMQPLIGHTVYDPSLYAYLIYRHAVEWAFETANLPIIKLSPWRYPYDSAFVVRHDFENSKTSIQSIESSASFEHSLGATPDYYFCTGTLREEMSNDPVTVNSIRNAITSYGATIGSHNGGLRNPLNSALTYADFDYWHWGPDEALNTSPKGYASGSAYARASLLKSFQDIEGWFAGTDNGRPGCGALGNCPRTWVAPYFNSSRDASEKILDDLGAVNGGEQKIGPLPHWIVSYATPTSRLPRVVIPASDWYVGAEIPGDIEDGHTQTTMKAAVDFYHGLGGIINLYGHIPSTSTSIIGQYVAYGVTVPRQWVTNAVGVADWWTLRSQVMVTPSCTQTGNTVIAQASISGAVVDPNTTVEIFFPNSISQYVGSAQVLANGAPVNPADYRVVGNTIKVLVGTATSNVQVQYSISNPVPLTTSLSPSSGTAGCAAFTLTVNGTGFVSNSTVQWNGSDRTTTYVSDTRLTATILAADMATAGNASVTVDSPAPGGGASNAQTFTINNSQAQPVVWTQTNWVGGAGQAVWSDATRYSSSSGISSSVAGLISLTTSSTVLFSDDFTRVAGGTLSPWLVSMGTWTITGGVLQGYNSVQWAEAYAYFTTTPQLTDYVVQGSIKIPAGAFGGGIGGRLDPATGKHYGAWVYPAGSAGGSNVLKLWKFPSWTGIDDTSVPMQQVSLSDVGTGSHTLQMNFTGNRIRVYYDGSLKIDVTDNNFGSTPAYLSGGISADWEAGSQAYKISVDNIIVFTLPAYGTSGTLLSSAYDGGDGVQWQAVSWDATTGNSTNVCVQTRTAGTSDQLANGTWSNCYSTSGSAITSANNRWIQYQLGLTTSNTGTSPVLSEIRISSYPGAAGAPLPVISGLAPASATEGGAAFTLTVNGSGFASNSTVQWNGASRTTTYMSATRLTAGITAADIATAGTATVTVFTPAPGGGTSNAQAFSILSIPAPAITTINPASTTAGGPAFTLTVNGSGFVSSSAVQWNGANRTTTYVTSSQLTAGITAADIATAGTATVTVYTPAPGGGTSNAQVFSILSIPMPAISTISPASATAGGTAFTLTVNGSGFVSSSTVQWNGANRTTTYMSATQLTAGITAADIATAGTATVTVFNPAPGGGTSNALTFTITTPSNPVPLTTSISPAAATAGGADFTLTVNGSGFVSGSTVLWNGASRTTTYVSSTRLTAGIMAADIATAGTASVTVFNPAPGGGTSNAQAFTVTTSTNPVPATTSISPSSRTARGAAFTLTVNGSGFVSSSTVQWNGASRTTTYVSSTQLTAAIPSSDIATAGTASVTVFNPAPGGGTSNAQTITINNRVPTITSISPSYRTHGGTAFTLIVNGSGIGTNSVVRWNGSNRTTTFVSSTRVTAAIPASDIAVAGTASVTVFNPAPGGGTSNARAFTIR